MHREKFVGAHSAMEVTGFGGEPNSPDNRQVGEIATLADYKKDVDEYDTGVYYADLHIGLVIDKLKKLGIYENTAIIVTGDHGECLGEQGSYNEHGEANYATTHIPLIIKYPGMAAGKVSRGFHYNVDLMPTLAELHGGFKKPWLPAVCGKGPEPLYDGESFAETLENGADGGREYLVVSQCAHVCQRAVRFGDYMYIRTYHDGYHLKEAEELFDIKNDPHETKNLAEEKPEICWHGAWYLEKWLAENMLKMNDLYYDDPMWRVIHEGGPFHTKGWLSGYCERLEKTGRAWAADELKQRHPREL